MELLFYYSLLEMCVLFFFFFKLFSAPLCYFQNVCYALKANESYVK